MDVYTETGVGNTDLLIVCFVSAHTEVMTDDEDGLLHMGHQAGSGHEGKKKKGIKRFFGK